MGIIKDKYFKLLYIVLSVIVFVRYILLCSQPMSGLVWGFVVLFMLIFPILQLITTGVAIGLLRRKNTKLNIVMLVVNVLAFVFNIYVLVSIR